MELYPAVALGSLPQIIIIFNLRKDHKRPTANSNAWNFKSKSTPSFIIQGSSFRGSSWVHFAELVTRLWDSANVTPLNLNKLALDLEGPPWIKDEGRISIPCWSWVMVLILMKLNSLLQNSSGQKDHRPAKDWYAVEDDRGSWILQNSGHNDSAILSTGSWGSFLHDGPMTQMTQEKDCLRLLKKWTTSSGLVFSVRAATMPDFHQENPNEEGWRILKGAIAGLWREQRWTVV